jgi:hypothetical protein
MVTKNQKKISLWVHRWLSRRGRLTLLKSMLSSIPMYWTTIEKLPKGILTNIQKICFHLVWLGNKEKWEISLVKWFKLALLKELGGWGIKNIYLYSRELATNSLWRLI